MSYTLEQKKYFMREALKEAKKGAKKDEVPVGAVIVKGDVIIARAHNHKEKKQLSTSHAEMEVIAKASKKLSSWYLDEADIFVTLEPCAMCSGALINSRLRALYFGASDKRFGCSGTLYNLTEDKRFNHTLLVERGILEKECAEILTDFFKNKREEKKKDNL